MLTNNIKEFVRGENRNFNKNITIRRGDIFYVDLGETKGSIQGGIRPCIATANNMCNKYSSAVQFIPVTSNLNKKKLPTHIFIPKNDINGLSTNSLILVEAVNLISTSQILEKVGRVSEEMMDLVDEKLELQLGLNKPDMERINILVSSIRGLNQVLNTVEEKALGTREIKQVLRMHLFDLKNYCKKFRLDYTEFYDDRKINTKKHLNNMIINNNLQRSAIRM